MAIMEGDGTGKHDDSGDNDNQENDSGDDDGALTVVVAVIRSADDNGDDKLTAGGRQYVYQTCFMVVYASLLLALQII